MTENPTEKKGATLFTGLQGHSSVCGTEEEERERKKERKRKSG